MRRKKAAKQAERPHLDELYKGCCCMLCAEAVENESDAIRHCLMTGHKRFMPRFLWPGAE
jgi:hypothetical protein